MPFSACKPKQIGKEGKREKEKSLKIATEEKRPGESDIEEIEGLASNCGLGYLDLGAFSLDFFFLSPRGQTVYEVS